jgi:hypothetical protein
MYTNICGMILYDVRSYTLKISYLYAYKNFNGEKGKIELENNSYRM